MKKINDFSFNIEIFKNLIIIIYKTVFVDKRALNIFFLDFYFEKYQNVLSE